MPVPVIGRNFATCVSADVFVAHLVLLLWGLDSMSELGESIFVSPMSTASAVFYASWTPVSQDPSVTKVEAKHEKVCEFYVKSRTHL